MSNIFIVDRKYGPETKAEIIKFLNNDYIFTCPCPKCFGHQPKLRYTYCSNCMGSGFMIVDKIKNEAFFLVRKDIKDRFVNREIEWSENKVKMSEEEFSNWIKEKQKELEKNG